MGNNYEIRTKKGYSFFEVASAFQKAIRRCDEKQAMYWAVELYESGYAKYAWKRMIIMSCEDVGLGTSNVNSLVWNLYESYNYLASLKEKHLPEKLPFTQAVLTLVHAKKSRYVDLAITYYWALNEKEMMEMPDYVFDNHTMRGKAMGRGRAYFYDEASKVNNPNYIPNEEEMRKMAYEIGGDHSQPIKENISCTEKEANEIAQLTLFDF